MKSKHVLPSFHFEKSQPQKILDSLCLKGGSKRFLFYRHSVFICAACNGSCTQCICPLVIWIEKKKRSWFTPIKAIWVLLSSPF